jgi:hypothetical protein
MGVQVTLGIGSGKQEPRVVWHMGKIFAGLKQVLRTVHRGSAAIGPFGALSPGSRDTGE